MYLNKDLFLHSPSEILVKLATDSKNKIEKVYVGGKAITVKR